MKETLESVLLAETGAVQALCRKLETMQEPIEPQQVKLFFDLILNLSAKTGMMQQVTYGKLHAGSQDPMFAGFNQQNKESLMHELEEMTQAKTPMADTGKRTRSTHYDLLANLYEEIYVTRAAYIILEDQNKENPYLLELLLLDSLYKAAKQKMSITICLLQVIQFLEPYIMKAMKNIVKNIVKPGTDELFFPHTVPQYIIEHESKDYHGTSILLKYYEAESAPKMVDGYCAKIAHTFNDAFERIDQCMFSRAHSTEEPVPQVSE